MASKTDAPEAQSEPPRSIGRRLVGWLLMLLGIDWAIYVYYGLGVPPGGMPTEWWHSTSFMLDWEWVGSRVDAPMRGAFELAIPAMLLTIGTFWATRSAIARAIAISSIFCALLFALIGLGGPQAWEFFHWRFTTVVVLSSLAIGCTLASPLLVKSWLRLPTPLGVILYVPIFFAVMAAVRGATGTSLNMPFLVSPWPFFTVFGLETAASLICGVLFGVAIGVLSLARGVGGGAIFGVLLAIVLPGVWTLLITGQVDARGFIFQAVVTAVAIGLTIFFSSRGADRAQQLHRRGLYAVLGAAMAFLPIFSGKSLAAGDFTVNRYIRAPEVVEALQSHIKKEEFYPEKLEDLVEAGYLDDAPSPRIGFGFLSALGLAEPVDYRYNEYGQSFVLEFDSSVWVQCSYSGNFFYDEAEQEDYEDEEDPWSCLGKQPNLFGDGAEERDDEEDYADDDE